MSSATDPGNRTSAQIETDVEATRANLTETLEQLRDKASPGQLFEQAIDYARTSGGAEFTRNLGAQVRDNPLPLLLIGAGIGWLMLGGNQRGGETRPAGRLRDYEDDYADSYGSTYAGRRAGVYEAPSRGYDAPSQGYDTGSRGYETPSRSLGGSLGERAASAGNAVSSAGGAVSGAVTGAVSGAASSVSDAARSAGGAVGDAAGSLRDTVADAAHQVADAASSAYRSVAGGLGRGGNRVSRYAGESRDRFGNYVAGSGDRFGEYADDLQYGATRLMREQPLVLGAIGIAIGAAIGALLPGTEAEDRMMGETRDELAERAQAMAQDGYERAREEVGSHAERARETVVGAAAGLVPQVREAVRETARDVAGRARGAMDEAEEAAGGSTDGQKSAGTSASTSPASATPVSAPPATASPTAPGGAALATPYVSPTGTHAGGSGTAGGTVAKPGGTGQV